MQVFFVGAQGTGKTSVMEALPSWWPKIKGVTRKCIAENKLTINQDATDDTQRAIFDAYEHALDVPNDFIAERSLYDVYAFTSFQYLNKKCSEQIIKEQAKRIAAFNKKHKDALFIYFPVEFAPEDDGQRSTDRNYQQAIDQIIFACLTINDVKFITVSGSVEERVKQIKKYVNF